MFAGKRLVSSLLLMIVLGGATVAVSASSASAAPSWQNAAISAPKDNEGAFEPTTASLIADIHLPSGATRAMSGPVATQFEQILQQAARSNQAKIASAEVLVWTGETAKTVIADMSQRLKASGYTLANIDPIASEDDTRVTPIAAARGTASEKLVGFWVETKEGEVVLVWGRLVPAANETAAPSTSTAPVTKTAAPKPAATVKKSIGPQKTTIATKAKQSTKTSTQARRTTTSPDKLTKAIKAYQDYQYVKFSGPISGPMYRSSKW